MHRIIIPFLSIFILAGSACCAAQHGGSATIRQKAEAAGTPRELTLMSYNVRNCKGIDNQSDVARTASVICRIKPEVVAIQEVDSMTGRSGGRYVLAELAEATGMIPLFAPAIDYDGGRYGIGILSRECPLSVRRIALPGREEARAAIVAEFPDYFFCSTHLSLTDADRQASARQFAGLAAEAHKPFFVAGDFNAHPDEPTIATFLEDFTPLTDTTRPTYPADAPEEVIDYIMIYAPTSAGVTVKQSSVVEAPAESDHRPITATVVL